MFRSLILLMVFPLFALEAPEDVEIKKRLDFFMSLDVLQDESFEYLEDADSEFDSFDEIKELES